MDYAIATNGLVKRFGSFTAVNGLNLRIKKGELFGFLGPNGAGKTTTIRILTTLTTPTEGDVKVNGLDTVTQGDEVRSIISVVPQGFSLFEELTPMENLWFIGELNGMGKDEIRERSEELLKIVNIYEWKDEVSAGFSGGMKQRLSVAASLLHRPQILVMDEPTTGLDPQSRLALRELTKKLNKSGITIIYTTHDMEEADKLCDRIAVMDHGQIIAEGTPTQLKEKYANGYHIKVELENNHSEQLAAELGKIAHSQATMSGKEIEITVPAINGEIINALSKHLSSKGVKVRELSIKEPSLEDVFINLTKKDLRD